MVHLRGQRGFSLIELSLAMVILAVLLLVGVPQFARFRANNELRAAANTLVTTITLAHTTACASALAVNTTPGAQQAVNNAQAPDLHAPRAVPQGTNVNTTGNVGTGTAGGSVQLMPVTSNGQNGQLGTTVQNSFELPVSATLTETGTVSTSALAPNTVDALVFPDGTALAFRSGNGQLPSNAVISMSNGTFTVTVNVDRFGTAKIVEQ